MFKKKKNPARPKYARAQNDEVRISCTPHRHVIPPNFLTGLLFYSPPPPQNTDLVFPLPSLPSSPLTTTSDQPCFFLAPKNLSISSDRSIPIVTPAVEASIPSGNILSTGPSNSLDYLKHLHTLPRKHELITYSPQFPCGIYISSPNPRATAILCLSFVS